MSKPYPTVSVVLPTYNRGDTICRALASISAQTIAPDEVLVIDDGSTDDTEGQVAHYSEVAYVKNQKRLGAAKSRNIGVAMARGDYIAFLDSDDIWLPHKLETQLNWLSKRGRVDLLVCGLLLRRLDGRYEPHLIMDSALNYLTISGIHTYPFCPSNWLIKKSLINEIGGFDEVMISCEDWDLCCRIMEAGVLGAVDEILTVKYNRSDSLDADRDKKINSYSIMIERYAGLWKSDKLGKAQANAMIAHLYQLSGVQTNARAAWSRAILNNPSNWRYYVKYIMSFFGLRLYRGFYDPAHLIRTPR